MADSNENIDLGKIRLSFIDVIYGVVIAYGFNFVDKMDKPSQYALFLMSFVAIVFDWVFVHQPYWKKIEAYKDAVLIVDLIILFLFSRIFASTTSESYGILLPLSLLFLFYSIWDFVFRKQLAEVGRPWLRDFSYDVMMFIAFAAQWFLFVFHTGAAAFLKQTFWEIPLWIGICYFVYVIYFILTFGWLDSSA